MKILLLAISNKRVQGAIAGLIAGYVIGSIWIGKEQDEMLRQLTQAVKIATGG